MKFRSYSQPLIIFMLVGVSLLINGNALCSSNSKPEGKESQAVSLTEQDKADLEWSSASGKAPSRSRSDSYAPYKPNNNTRQETQSKGIARASANLSHQGQTVINQSATSTIGDLEAIIKLLNQEESTIDLKAVGDSIVVLRRKITDNPRDPALRQRLGVLLYLAGDLEGACAELRQAVSLKPENYVAHALLGKVLSDAGEQRASSLEFHNAIALCPGSAANHYLYAQSLAARGDLSQAINEYRRAIGIKVSADPLIGLAESLITEQDIDGAVKAARQAVSEEPNSADAHVVLTKALLLSGNTQAAVRTAREALLLNPNSAQSHIAVGRSLYATGKIEAAVEEFKQAVSLNPLDAEARNDLGYALYGKGDIVNALREFRLALRLNPHLGEARNNLEIAVFGLAGKKHN